MRYLLLIFSCMVFLAGCNNKEKDSEAGEAAGTKGLPDYVIDLEKRVQQYPDSAGLRSRLIDAYDSLGMYKEGIAHTDLLLKKDSLNNGIWMKKAMLEEKAKDTAGAILSYARSINIYPAPDAQLYLANIFAERKNDTALLLVNNVSRTMFDSRTLAECDFIAGVYHARKGNLKMAEDLFNRCVSRDVKFMEAYIEKGLLYYDRKQFAEALKIFQAAGNVEPTYADAFYYQARCYEALGQTQEAIKMYQQSLRLDPGLKEASEGLGRLGVQVS